MEAFNELVNKASISYPYIGIGTNFANNSLHFHKELEILYVLEGEICVCIEGKNQDIKKGDICIVMPEQIHSLFQSGQIRLFVLKLLPSVSLLFTQLEGSVLKGTDAHHKPIEEMLLRILAEDEKRALGYELAVNNACGEITLCILRELGCSSEGDLEKKATDLAFFEAVRTYIEKNYKGKVSLSSASAALGYSEAYFSRRFKTACGINFFDYLTVFRLKKSIELLQDRTLSIEGIALASGYSCLRSYNRAFRKHFLKTPGAYRKGFFSQKD